MSTRWKSPSIYGPVAVVVPTPKPPPGYVRMEFEETEAQALYPRDDSTGGPKGWKLVQQEDAKR